MELIFNQVQNRWEAEFEANADFNLHIDGVLEGNISVFQRGTASGQYALVRKAKPNPTLNVNVYDYDFSSLVYPKFIKVSCATEPTYAEVVSDGEIKELMFQTKTVEVKKNGTTTISPDNGFTALNAVKVKVNVPTEGGGTSGELERNDVNFFDYDGTLLYAYSWEEAKNLTELPTAPEHEGLVTYGWNYTIEDFNALAATGFKAKVDVAVECYDSDGNLMMGDFILIVPRGGDYMDTTYSNRVFEEVSIPYEIKLEAYSFTYCTFLNEVKCSYTSNFESFYAVFEYCRMRGIYINAISTEQSVFHFGSLTGSMISHVFEIPESVYVYQYSTATVEVQMVKFPKLTTRIDFVESSSGRDVILDFTELESVPETYGIYCYQYGTGIVIIVPDALYEEWISATNWSDAAEYIVKKSDMPESLFN